MQPARKRKARMAFSQGLGKVEGHGTYRLKKGNGWKWSSVALSLPHHCDGGGKPSADLGRRREGTPSGGKKSEMC